MAKPGPIARPVEERFWKFVNKTDECWLWTGLRSNLRLGRALHLQPHGTYKRYRSGCKCSECRQANSDYSMFCWRKRKGLA